MRLRRSRRRRCRAFSKPSCSNRNRSRRPRGRKRKPNSSYSNNNNNSSSKRNNNSSNLLKQLRMNPNKPNQLHQLINQSHKLLHHNSQHSHSNLSQPNQLNNSLKLQLLSLVRIWRSTDSKGTRTLLHLLEQRPKGTLSDKRFRINWFVIHAAESSGPVRGIELLMTFIL